MEKIIKVLEETGVVDRIQKSINRAGGMTGEVPQEMNHNEPLEDAVIDYAMNKAMAEIVGTLGIKFTG